MKERQNSKKKPTVLVGMSGGVDSSVAAALLQKRGYDVIGMTFQLLPPKDEKRSACCNLNAVNDAKRVADSLGIPHYTVNIRDEFKTHVIDPFVQTYLDGETPNPCVECNRFIKFTHLDQKAKALGIDYIATGHYCIRSHTRDKSHYYLKPAKDAKKDQSYFLYMLTSDQLKRTLFPLGHYTKPEIRDMAESFGLITAQKSDSQEICFVTSGSYRDFINESLSQPEAKPGPILSVNGEELGTHKGLYHYTVGQRKGLNIHSQVPLYVIKISPETNSIVVGDVNDLQTSEIKLKQFSKYSEDLCLTNQWFSVKTRYQMIPFRAKVMIDDSGHCVLHARTPQSGITAGQSAVLYAKNKIVGGGIITY